MFVLLQHPYEDPEGRIDLPASIKCDVDHWKRPIEFMLEKVPKREFRWIYILTYLLPVMPSGTYGSCAVSVTNNYLRDEVVSLKPNPHTWRTRRLPLVWTLLFDLFRHGRAGPARGMNPRWHSSQTHKPLSHAKAPVLLNLVGVLINYMYMYWNQNSQTDEIYSAAEGLLEEKLFA